jgi:AcrR family transcriptional regulator
MDQGVDSGELMEADMAEVVTEEGVKPGDLRPSRAPVQKRGQLRVEAILDAAESVFRDVGVEAGTTNAIAERAGSSVGSLYHFFPNKDAILQALAERYADSMTTLLRKQLRIDEPWVPLGELFPQMISAFARMDEVHPGYMAVCRATDVASGGKSPISLQMEAHMQVMVRELLGVRMPGIPESDAARHAALSVVVVHSVLDHATSVAEPMRSGILAALVEMMVGHFGALEARYPRSSPG